MSPVVARLLGVIFVCWLLSCRLIFSLQCFNRSMLFQGSLVNNFNSTSIISHRTKQDIICFKYVHGLYSEIKRYRYISQVDYKTTVLRSFFYT